MKILEITHSFVRFKNDYISRFLLTLFEGLKESGEEIKVIAPHAEGLKEKEIISGIDVERFKYAQDWREILAYKGNMHEIAFSSPFNIVLLFDFIASAFRNVKKNISDYDIVHLHWWIPFGIPISILTKKYNKPFVISLHGTDVRLIKKIKPLRFVLKWLSGRVDRFVVVSEFIRRTISKYGIEENKLEVIPMPVEEELFYPRRHRNSTKIVLTIARFSKQKRIDRILKVAEKFKGKPVEFHIVGSGEKESEIKSFIEIHGLYNVKLIPPMKREMIAKKIRKSDLFLLLSENEGFGMVVVESMLSGVPVILSRSGGFYDLVEDEFNGLLVNGDDYDTVAGAISRLLENNKFRSFLIKNGLKSAKKYTRKNIAKKFETLFLALKKQV
ncbi:MAG TPA: glycosyltransferase family 4 protein [Firmicutes bacterium]|uniref:Glycosyltransferase family 4 protein n=1 Tax=candidate division TA06 bacterium TaxID=2250710 RepID=A0A660S908_UNCT6|nr:MAG: hypothetical protein DRP44_03140 [candidate division TA06 bacterium]HFD04557.1 glycosyltransferase family 4 protein [Bacillota bacterium]